MYLFMYFELDIMYTFYLLVIIWEYNPNLFIIINVICRVPTFIGTHYFLKTVKISLSRPRQRESQQKGKSSANTK